MSAALDDYVVLGISTSISFLKDVIRNPEFRAGKATTGFIGKHFEGWREGKKDEGKMKIALVAAAFDELGKESGQNFKDKNAAGLEDQRHFLAMEGPREMADRRHGVMDFEFMIDGEVRKISLEKKDGGFEVLLTAGNSKRISG